jgi:hypothetical protein
VPAGSEIDRELGRLEAALKQLEAEYNMFFAGQLSRPPWETRSRVTTMVRQLDRIPIQNYGERFRFTTLQTRYSTFIDLWDRGLRAREEGRRGPFAGKRQETLPQVPASDRVLHVAAFRDPRHEMDKLHELHAAIVEARRQLGKEAVPFETFADLVTAQVQKLMARGSREVAFRVAVVGGKVSFTARALKGARADHT